MSQEEIDRINSREYRWGALKQIKEAETGKPVQDDGTGTIGIFV
jgi:hypothetical protein